MNEKIKTLQIIHLAICAGTILAYYFLGELSLEKLSMPNIDSASLVYVFIPVLAFVFSSFLFRSQLKQIDPKLKVEEKLPFYQAASIMRWAVLKVQRF
ncbi:MFS transporter [Flavobacterium sp. ACN6]|uniref:MFS transporter n=1 Tax=Flavobacterium sp. ACN6 TaxID=1920426 RepID=UPI000BB33C16|nr:MFS transporter [Flavobacterium sp. ACN6]PBJ06832.1 hypothetical protein BSF42_40070 [Flavobacterium sp. ACN6]